MARPKQAYVDNESYERKTVESVENNFRDFSTQLIL